MPLLHQVESFKDLGLHLSVCEALMEDNAQILQQGQEMLDQLTRYADQIEARLLDKGDDGNLEQMEADIQNHLYHLTGPESFFEDQIETLGKHGDLLMDIFQQFGDIMQNRLAQGQTSDDGTQRGEHYASQGREDPHSLAESRDGSHENQHQDPQTGTQERFQEHFNSYYRQVQILLAERRSGLELWQRMQGVKEKHAKHENEATGQWEDLLEERKRFEYLLRVVQLLLDKRAPAIPTPQD